jgi:flagellar hook-associated protein 1
MTLNLSINNALSGLRVAQKSLDLVSHNIANAQTEGYTRKTRAQESVVIGGTGYGVRDLEVKRNVDQSLQREVWRQTGQLKNLETTETYLKKIEQLSGRPEDETSVSALLSDVRKSFESLTTTPESTTFQLDTITKANYLATGLNQLATSMLQTRNDAQIDLDATLKDTNAVLKRIDELNEAVVRATQSGSATPDLEDQRDEAVRKLSEYVDISYAKGQDGRLIIMTKSGQTLVERDAATFHFTSSTLGAGSFYRFVPPNSVGAAGATNVNPIRLNNSVNGDDVTLQLTGGKVGALLALRDKTLPTMSAQLDELAHKLALRFQAAGMTLFTGNDGVSIPGNTLGANVGFAANIRLASAADNSTFVRFGDNGTPTTPPNTAVSNGRIEQVLTYAFGTAVDAAGNLHTPFRTTYMGPDPLANLTSTLPANSSIEDYARSLITDQGQRRNLTTAEVKETTTLRDAIQTQLKNESGVNLDTELAQLTILQRTYGASAQILRTTQSLLDDLFASVR